MGILFNEQGQPLDQALTLQLSTPRKQGGTCLFGALFKLSLSIDSAVTALELAEPATLAFSFEPMDVAIQDQSAGWHLHPVKAGDPSSDRVYDLALPVRLHHLSSSAYAVAKLYRMDGPKRVDDATLSVAMGQPLTDDFTAAHFTVGLESPTGSTGPLSLHVQGRPTSPRLKLRMGPVEDAGETLWQWLDHPGEQTQACGTTIHAAAWKPALARALAVLRKKPLAEQAQLLLTLEAWSDAPCTLKLTPTQFTLQTQAGPDGASRSGKVTAQAMRFGGAVHQCQSITLPQPLLKASSVAVRLGITPSDSLSASNLPAAAGLGQQGFALQSGNGVSRAWPVDAACFVAALAVPWWPLEAASALTLSLHAEQAGHVQDTPMAQASVNTATSGPHWLVFRWSEVSLQPGPYWVRLRATDGGGIWLGEATDAPVRIIRQAAQQPHQHLQAPLQPIVAMLAIANSNVPRVHCTLDGQPMSLQPDADQQAEHWVARLDKLPALPGAGVLTICCDDPVLVSVRDVVAQQALT